MPSKKRETRIVGFQATPEQKVELAEDVESLGFASVSELLRTAWRLARMHPELLEEAYKEEIEYQRSRPLSGHHPDVVDRSNEQD